MGDILGDLGWLEKQGWVDCLMDGWIDSLIKYGKINLKENRTSVHYINASRYCISKDTMPQNYRQASDSQLKFIS